MLRAAIELLVTIILVIAARAILTSFLKGVANSSATAFQRGPQDQPSASGASQNAPSNTPPKGSELHKDPVCGTYVAESTQFRRQAGGQPFDYCSEDCKAKHALVAR